MVNIVHIYNLKKGFIYGDFLFIEVILFVYIEIIYLIYFYINKGNWGLWLFIISYLSYLVIIYGLAFVLVGSAAVTNDPGILSGLWQWYLYITLTVWWLWIDYSSS